MLVDEGGQAVAGEGELLHGPDGLWAGHDGVVAVALAVTELNIYGGVVEGEGGDTGVAVAVGLHWKLDVPDGR